MFRWLCLYLGMVCMSALVSGDPLFAEESASSKQAVIKKQRSAKGAAAKSSRPERSSGPVTTERAVLLPLVAALNKSPADEFQWFPGAAESLWEAPLALANSPGISTGIQEESDAVLRNAGDWLRLAFPIFRSPGGLPTGLYSVREAGPSNRRLIPRSRARDGSLREDGGRSAAGLSPSSKSGYELVEIEVSHSKHRLKVIGHGAPGRRDVLFETRVGLGSSGFPTPKGVYYVTHIYDDSPLWIPPPNRAWAAGQRPSRSVYGGTMAPLLKKRPERAARVKKPETVSEDFVEGKMRLDDYGYRFHGTNAPRSIGGNQSHGCVRMLPEDARTVAALIKAHIGIAGRRSGENGTYVTLLAPVRLTIVN
ncbi:MAG: L,D-transpeptidase [Deltaproteobacteria bacterium]|nr:L,D-transpeptidase [Deltaproteobacteria bacterium]